MPAALLPDTPHRWDAWGDPEAIPDLTFAQTVDFHREHYRPGRALVFTYGAIPVEEYAAFLDAHLAGERQPDGAAETGGRQPRWTAPRRAEFDGPLPSEGIGAGEAWLAVRWLCGDAGDPADALALQVLAGALLGWDGAPLRRALVDARLGAAVTQPGYVAYGAEASIGVGVTGAEPASCGHIERVVLSALDRVAAEGLPEDDIEASFRRAAYEWIEPWDLPIRLRQRAIDGWRLAGDPYGFLRPREHLASCRARWGGRPRTSLRG